MVLMGIKFSNKLFINVVVLALISIAFTLRRDDRLNARMTSESISWVYGTWVTLTDDGRVYCQFVKDKDDALSGFVFNISDNGDTNIITRYKVNFKMRNYLMQAIDYNNQETNITNYQMVRGNKNKILFECKNETDIKLLQLRHTNNDALVVVKNDSYSQNKSEDTFIKLKN